MNLDVIIYTVGEVGAGKTYRRFADFVLKDFIPNGDPESVYYTNIPVQFEPWVGKDGKEMKGLVAVAKEHGIDEETIRARVKVIPAKYVEAWKNKDLQRDELPVCPWHYFEDENLPTAKAHVAIDEVQNYCPRQGSPRTRKAWEDFLGEARKTGATWEFITQAPDKVAKCIGMHCTTRYLLERSEGRRDPWFKIPLFDWYQIRFIMSGSYTRSAWQTLQKKRIYGDREKWVDEESVPFWFDADYYHCYDSFARGSASTLEGAQADPPCFRMSKMRLLLWFISRNWWRLIFNPSVAAVAMVVGLFCLAFFLAGSNGMSFLMGGGDKEKDKAAQVQVGQGRVRTSADIKKVGVDPVTVDKASKSELAELAELSDQVLHLRGVVDSMKTQISTLDAENEKLRERLKAEYAVVAIGAAGVTFRSGLTYREGERIDYGYYAGRSIASVDWRHRLVRLDDGTLLALGGVDPDSWLSGLGETAKTATQPVRNFLSPVDGSPGE